MMIENKLIAIHQWIIDATQKKPGWWAEQTIMGATAIDMVKLALTWDGVWSAVSLIMILLCATGGVLVARNESSLKLVGASFIVRRFFIALVVYQVYLLFTSKQVSINILEVLSVLLVLSYYCFAACEAPRPKKRKEKLVLRVA